MEFSISSICSISLWCFSPSRCSWILFSFSFLAFLISSLFVGSFSMLSWLLRSFCSSESFCTSMLLLFFDLSLWPRMVSAAVLLAFVMMFHLSCGFRCSLFASLMILLTSAAYSCLIFASHRWSKLMFFGAFLLRYTTVLRLMFMMTGR